MLLRNALMLICLTAGLFACSSDSIDEANNDWSVTLYDNGTNQLITLSESGMVETDLPNINYEPRRFENSDMWYVERSHVRVSPDSRYLISLVPETPSSYARVGVITNLDTGETYPVELPPMTTDEFFVSFGFGTFNNDISEIALNYVSNDATSGGVVTVDLATGTITYVLNTKTMFNESTAWLGDWDEDGIQFSPRCNGCSPLDIGEYQLWNPDTGETSTTNVYFDLQDAERLDATGELLYSENHEDYPLGGSAFPPILNVVTLYESDETPLNGVGRVVYFDSSDFSFDRRAHWIMNGWAFLVTNNRQRNVIVFRDGAQLTYDYPDEEFFVAMTSDGWLTFDRDNNDVLRYIVSDQVITRQQMYRAIGEIEVANMQLSPPTNDLPSFDFEISPPDVVFCPGAVPNNLEAGDWAEVLYEPESVDVILMTLAIGDVPFEEFDYSDRMIIPQGSHVQILEDLVCDSYGAVYAKIAYQNVIGWRLVIYRDVYSFAPIDAPDE